MSKDPQLGLSGHITRMFIGSPLTPLFLLAALALGLVALSARGGTADIGSDGGYTGPR
jgi:hypothetical protein